MTDLQRLIEAWEQGDPDAWHGAGDILGVINGDHVARCYNGNLNAAKALHDALLPGHYFDVWRATNFDDEPRKFACDVTGVNTIFAPCPARAWGLAILKAYQAQQEAAQ